MNSEIGYTYTNDCILIGKATKRYPLNSLAIQSLSDHRIDL